MFLAQYFSEAALCRHGLPTPLPVPQEGTAFVYILPVSPRRNITEKLLYAKSRKHLHPNPDSNDITYKLLNDGVYNVYLCVNSIFIIEVQLSEKEGLHTIYFED